MPVLHALPLTAHVLLFAAAAALIWAAGTRLARHADVVAERTGLGSVFVGTLLLGGVTSLPEVAATASAAAIGNAPLAVNNLLGGIAAQVAILSLADLIVRGRALSSRIDSDAVLLQAALLVLVLCVVVAGVLLEDRPVFGFGAWTLGLFAVCVLSILLVQRQEEPGQSRWHPVRRAKGRQDGAQAEAASQARAGASARSIVISLLFAGAIVLVAGSVLAISADAIATRTGLGGNFVGLAILAVATSLPEISTTIGAVRQGAYAMAYGNIFGTNIFDASIILLADGVYAGPPVLNEVGTFSAFAGLLGITLTAVWLVGLLRRRRHVVVGLGYDAAAVVLLYLAGLAALFTMR